MLNIDKILEKETIKYQKIRQKLFSPIIIFLSKRKVSANLISVLKIPLGILYVLLIEKYLIFALSLLIIAIILDLFDGPLARYNNTASDRGKFVDVFCDYIIHACFMFGLIIIGAGSLKLLTYNIIIIPIIYLLAILHKNENKTSNWLISPTARSTIHRIIVQIPVLLYLFLNMHIKYLNIFLLIANIATTLNAIYYFYIFLKNHQKYLENHVNN